MRRFRTPPVQRTNYVFTFANGTKTTLKPGEYDVTEMDIEISHHEDDLIWNNDSKHSRKHNGQFPTSYEEVDENEAWIFDDSSDPLEQFIAKEEIDRLHVAIEKLPPKQAEAINKVFFSEIPACDLAKSWGCSEANISNIIHRGLANLLKYLLE
jgi:RNA polymerase sigma factor (sigma-70 family)